MRNSLCVLLIALGMIQGSMERAFAAQALPRQLDDVEFWRTIESLSEPGGAFQFENLLSNETDYPRIMSQLQSTVRPGGVYMGVGPEQNFNYIAAIRPDMAFIIDIRRQNLLEHLLYKALFELSPDRGTFVSRLFSRKAPQGLTPAMTAAELFDAYSEIPPDASIFQSNLRSIETLLLREHGFPLSANDRRAISDMYAAFRDFGPLIDYSSGGGGPGLRAFSPSYTQVMTETDSRGREWSYLAGEENYKAVRDLEVRNLIVPLTGDFGGPKAIRAVGEYAKDRGARISVFYASNVEGYLLQGGDRQGNSNGGSEAFYGNLATLPLDDASTLIRWVPNLGWGRGADSSISFAPIAAVIDDYHAGRLTADVLLSGRRFGRGFSTGPGVLLPGWPVWFARIRFASISLAPLSAFLIRYFMWSPVNERNGTAPGRRILFSTVWAACALFLALGFTLLIGVG